MRRILFFRLVLLTIPLLFNSAKSQSDPFAYAVTAVNKGGTDWIALRKMDMRTGAFGPTLLNIADSDQHATGFPATKLYGSQAITSNGNDASGNIYPQMNGQSVAAIAYDKRNNRLFFSPMYTDQLHYIDLNTMKSFALAGQFFSKAGKYEAKNAGPINRMVIAADGFGYTITNDGNHLMRFTTDGTPILTDLGDVMEDPMNKEMNIHSPCTASGGDLIADDAGHLYLITGNNKVFKIDISTKIATYQAGISGLPEKFTTSGVAVSENGKQLFISSSTYSDASYLIDPQTWSVSSSPNTPEKFESSDLANSNILITKSDGNAGLFISKNSENQGRIRIFPNPLQDDDLHVQFNELPAGYYTIELTSALGSTVMKQNVIISSNSQTEILHIPRNAAQGFYYIHILDQRKTLISTQKLVVERW